MELDTVSSNAKKKKNVDKNNGVFVSERDLKKIKLRPKKIRNFIQLCIKVIENSHKMFSYVILKILNRRKKEKMCAHLIWIPSKFIANKDTLGFNETTDDDLTIHN